MNITEPRTFELGPYTVQRRHDADIYRVFLGSVLIGKCYSRPCESDCAWLERQQREQTFYAYSSAKLPELSKNENGTRRSVGDARRAAEARAARTRRIGATRKAKTPQDVAKALAGG